MIRLTMSPLTESATLLRRAGVVLGSVGLTALYSLLVLLRALFGQLNRPIVDKYCREWSAALLRLVRVSLTVRGAVPDFGDGRLLPFKKGCFHLALGTQAVIVPVAVRGIHKVLPARTWRINLGQPVDVRVGAPIDTSGKGKEDLVEVMADVRGRLEDLLGNGEAA